jgi:hypothetical protein
MKGGIAMAPDAFFYPRVVGKIVRKYTLRPGLWFFNEIGRKIREFSTESCLIIDPDQIYRLSFAALQPTKRGRMHAH